MGNVVIMEVKMKTDAYTECRGAGRIAYDINGRIRPGQAEKTRRPAKTQLHSHVTHIQKNPGRTGGGEKSQKQHQYIDIYKPNSQSRKLLLNDSFMFLT